VLMRADPLDLRAVSPKPSVVEVPPAFDHRAGQVFGGQSVLSNGNTMFPTPAKGIETERGSGLPETRGARRRRATRDEQM
jgi:hypothetical protein